MDTQTDHHPSRFAPSRRALNPVLLDAPVMEAADVGVSVFYTPSAQWLDRHLPLISSLLAGACLLSAYIAARTGAPHQLAHLLTLIPFVIAGLPALKSVWDTIREPKIDIDVLMLLGAGLAAVIGSAMEGALLLVLFALSGALEGYALQRTQAAIVGLRKLSPHEALLLDGRQTRKVSLKEVGKGQRILIRPGDRVPLDGTVVEGASAVDESAITGESIPREKTAGDAVFAGTMNKDGRLVVEVTKLASDTALARIVQLVTEARHKTARAQRLIDRIGPAYSTLVILLAIAVAVSFPALFGLAWKESIRRGIAVLIVGSPCALIIATPVAYLSAIAAAARKGVLIKGGLYLEQLARTQVMVYDKTGTLTTGVVQLVDILPLTGLEPDEALRLAAAIESSSTHPLAGAVTVAAAERNLDVASASDFNAVAGEGLSAVVEGVPVWIGRPSVAMEDMDSELRRQCRARLEKTRSAGRTAAVMRAGADVVVFAFADTLREGAAPCVAALRRQGVVRQEMLTGDHEQVASAIARQVGLDGFHATLLPDQKLEVARRLREKYGHIVMAGDGVNDAPALVEADVGIAIGSIGADVALEAADVVLMGDRIEQIGWLHQHARRTASIVRQNLSLAIGVIGVLGVCSLFGVIPLPLAVVGHEGSTVLVALNAIRLLRSTPG